MISPPTLRFDLQGLSRIEGGRLVKILGPVLCPEVAGGVRFRPVNWRPRERAARRERRGGEEREMVSRNGNPKSLNSDFSQIFTKLPLTITFSYELRFTCTSCLRTRFNETYNFCEETLTKI